MMLPVPGRGRRFALAHCPPREVDIRGAVLHVHAFGEEMNKSRRMVGIAARALATQGFGVLQMDLYGCGDSDGDFEAATWEQWQEDLQVAYGWLMDRYPQQPLWLWSHRAGALLAGAMAALAPQPVHHLLWQPMLKGRQVLQTLLRMKGASAWASGDGKAVIEQARADLAAGTCVEIAGYVLSPGMASALERAEFAAPVAAESSACVIWLELSTQAEAELTPVAKAQVERWCRAGASVTAQCVPGPAFWQTVEVEDAPALVDATAAALTQQRAQAHIAHGGERSSMETSRRASETPQVFRCTGDHLVGQLRRPPETATASRIGVLIVVGGPQYRAGSHRQFVQWSRAVAAAGFPCLCFDVRGMGDSTGARRSFLDLSEDIAAAIGRLTAPGQDVDLVVLAGLCDGASASLLYLDSMRDPRVIGLILMNPWVRTAETHARTQVKHYYAQRLRDRDFWAKLLRGRVAMTGISDLGAAMLRTLRAGRSRFAANTRDVAASYSHRMARALSETGAPTLLVLSGEDYTAKEFLEHCANDPLWRHNLVSPRTVRLDLPQADHTFSRTTDRLTLQAASVQWLNRLESIRLREAS